MGRWILVFVLILAATGCPRHFRIGGHPPDTEDMRFANYRSTPLCYDNYDSGRDSYTSPDRTLRVDHPVEQTVRRLMCAERPDGELHAQLYRRFDPRQIDALTAAMMITTCVGDGRCQSEERRVFSGRQRLSYSQSGALYPYAVRLDMHQVAAAVAPMDLDDDMKSLFVDRVAACRQHLVQVVESWNPRIRRIYVDVPEQVLEQRYSDELALAAHYGRLDELRPRIEAAVLDRTSSEPLRQEAALLRSEYVHACVARGRTSLYCLNGPVGRPLTQYLMQLAVRADDAPVAVAEHALLSSGPDQSDIRYEIHEAIGRAMRKETQDYRRYAEAVSMSVDPGLLSERFGSTPPVDLSNRLNATGITPPSSVPMEREVRTMRRQVDHVRRVVARTRVRGELAVVSFQDIVDHHQEQTGCRESNRVEAITSSGELIYRLHCSGPWITRTTRDRQEPVTVTAEEAVGLSRGQTVLVAVDRETRRGAIVQVFADEDRAALPIRLRTFALESAVAASGEVATR